MSSSSGADFSADFWEQAWQGDLGEASMRSLPPHPRVVEEVSDLPPGTALDVGCGAGAEVLALAQAGWTAIGVDISAQALHHAAQRAEAAGLTEQVSWRVADATTWEPEQRYDLVLSCYAHAPMPQEEFYERLSDWVAPGGHLVLIGHRHHHDDRPEEASTTADRAAARFSPEVWETVTAEEHIRTLQKPDGTSVPLHDVIVHLRRRSPSNQCSDS
ncbi:SAM-dependent methyltransferase [Nesterenkonia lacusekhoensis]|uniref:Cyclopropane fatty-acyl-phospholipid synthase-like methyltransferase n=1 Tax=Nesterenkonia lacusekhoensis TaxID=150832 RepID=A0ABS4SZW1_9MICC|nr:class I SAM-dependent methyltransferase [Nesterenkonia lacusekhoensis]MBP2317744.1 cyclopropane fatty-acyl-phospholipid synthase-like methyltransferase [Nesterenkonia lacusekhoensis]